MVLTTSFFSIKHYRVPGQSNKFTVTIWNNHELPSQTFYNNIQRVFFVFVFLSLRGFCTFFFLVMGKYYNTKANNHSSFARILLIKKNKCELLVRSKPNPQNFWSTWHLCSLLLALLSNEGFVDVGNDTSSSNCCLDKGIQLFVTSDGQLQVTGSDTLHLQVFGGVTRQL